MANEKENPEVKGEKYKEVITAADQKANEALFSKLKVFFSTELVSILETAIDNRIAPIMDLVQDIAQKQLDTEEKVKKIDRELDLIWEKSVKDSKRLEKKIKRNTKEIEELKNEGVTKTISKEVTLRIPLHVRIILLVFIILLLVTIGVAIYASKSPQLPL